MRKTFKYRIYPTKGQAKIMLNALEQCRWVYNQTLAHRKDAWEQRQESIGLYKSNLLLPIWKQERPELKAVYSQALQDVQERVDLGLKAFFRRVKAGENPGYPRFRGRERYDSFTYPQFGFGIKDGRLNLSKVGDIKINLHRPIEGKVKTCSIRRRANKWYACFSCEVESRPLPQSDKAVGIDVGLEAFATLSTGEKVANPRFFRTDEKALAKAQRKMCKQAEGTPERTKSKKVVSRIHERIADRRHNFVHQESRRIINAFGIIAVEKLNIGGMLGNHCLAKSISDASWNQFIATLQAKAEYAGREFVTVNPKGTSQLCSRCHSVVPKDLSIRIHSCPICGLVLDRDLNASYNILALGLQGVGSIPRSPRL